MCPLGAGQFVWWLLILGAIGLVGQARRYRHGSLGTRAALVGWGLWLAATAWAGLTTRLEQTTWVVGVSLTAVLWFLVSGAVVFYDWRAATRARQNAEKAIDRRMQAELAQLLRSEDERS